LRLLNFISMPTSAVAEAVAASGGKSHDVSRGGKY
jgi:hypothetical protein